MNWNQKLLDTAEGYLGLKEWPGAKSNPEVEALFKAAGHPGLTDDVPWCAGFVGAVIAQVGLIPSGSLMARSYATWGQRVPLQEAMPGDVVVLARGAPPAAHVGFFLRFDGTRVWIRGGNQGDAVSDASFPATGIVAVRRADPSIKQDETTVRRGSKNASVINLQTRLRMLGYFSGKIDGDFGSLTDGAVRAFQADQGLDVDGIVGNRTWEALKNAQPRPKRDVSADDLRKRGSETIKAADSATVATGVAGAAAVLPVAADVIERASGIIPTLSLLWQDHKSTILLLIALGVAVWMIDRARKARVKAAVTGENLSK